MFSSQYCCVEHIRVCQVKLFRNTKNDLSGCTEWYRIKKVNSFSETDGCAEYNVYNFETLNSKYAIKPYGKTY